jgi:hypothetical protein
VSDSKYRQSLSGFNRKEKAFAVGVVLYWITAALISIALDVTVIWGIIRIAQEVSK